MNYHKVEYSTAAGLYHMTYDVKLEFYMSEISSSNIILHQFHVDNNEGESGNGYGMIIGRNLMVKIVLSAEFNFQVLQ